MATQELKQRVTEALDQWNEHNLERYLALYEPDAGLPFLPPPLPRNLEGLSAFYQMFWGGFSNLQLTVDDMLAEGNQVAVHFHVSGTHDGPFMEVPPTGRSIEASGMSFMTFNPHGRVTLRHNLFDLAGLMQQIGGNGMME